LFYLVKEGFLERFVVLINMINNKGKITKIEDVITVSKRHTESWFRGQPKTYGNLTPRIFREEYRNEVYLKFRPDPDYEIAPIERFKQIAPSLYANVPQEEDDLGWLILMQHHGAPTRLLDWTENILIALYFAVNDFSEVDGEIWALYPPALNIKNGFWGIPIKKNASLQYLVKEIYYIKNKKVNLVKSLKLPSIPKYPLAFYPTWKFLRMIVQSSTFTIHPIPEKGNQLTDIFTKGKDFFRYIVPAKYKSDLLKSLNLLGIKRYRLFPDLDSLSQDIISELKTFLKAIINSRGNARENSIVISLK
jgi:hypothetical protein